MMANPNWATLAIWRGTVNTSYALSVAEKTLGWCTISPLKLYTTLTLTLTLILGGAPL